MSQFITATTPVVKVTVYFNFSSFFFKVLVCFAFSINIKPLIHQTYPDRLSLKKTATLIHLMFDTLEMTHRVGVTHSNFNFQMLKLINLIITIFHKKKENPENVPAKVAQRCPNKHLSNSVPVSLTSYRKWTGEVLLLLFSKATTHTFFTLILH